MLLTQLLKDFPLQRFLGEYYLKLPFAQVQGCRDVVPNIDRSALLEILKQPDIDFIAGRGGQRWPGVIPGTQADLEALLSEGYTAGVRRAERHDAAIAALAGQFQSELAGPVNIHVYCTPAGNPGFGWHYDAEEVFILQTTGEKDWYLRKNTVNPWPLIETIPANQRYEREIMPALHCRLAAGDWLYIPSGYWHRTAAESESISLSVGLQPLTGIDLLDFVRPSLLQSLQWRQRLPCAGAAVAKSEDELAAAYSEIVTTLSQDITSILTSPQLVKSFLESVRFKAAESVALGFDTAAKFEKEH